MTTVTTIDGRFDLDSDVPMALVTLAGGDKFLVADVSATGIPNAFILARDLKTFLEFKVTDVNERITASQVADNDVMVLGDVSDNGANKKITISQVKSLLSVS